MPNVTNPIPECSPDSPEWAFRAVAMINERDKRIEKLEEALRDAERVLEWGEPNPKPVLGRVRRVIEENRSQETPHVSTE